MKNYISLSRLLLCANRRNTKRYSKVSRDKISFLVDPFWTKEFVDSRTIRTLIISPTKDAMNILSSFMSSFSKISCEKKKDEKIIPRNCERFVYLIINCPSNYLETATSTILHDDAYVRWIGTGSDESVQIIVSQVSHLEKRSLICTWIGILGFDVLEATG